MPEPDELVEACLDGGRPSCIVIERVPAACSVYAAAVADIIASEFDDYEVWDRAERENIVDLNRELITPDVISAPDTETRLEVIPEPGPPYRA